MVQSKFEGNGLNFDVYDCALKRKNPERHEAS